MDEYDFVEGKNQCPKCAEEGRDVSGDNFYWYGEDDGGYCFACQFVVKSKDQPQETVKEGGAKLVTVSAKDLKKLEEKRLTDDQLATIFKNTEAELKSSYRLLDKKVCESLGVRWTYDESGKVKDMLFPAKIEQDGSMVVTGYKVRGNPKDFYSKGYVGKANLFAGQTYAVAEALVIVGGEVDLITAKQLLQPIEAKYKRQINVVSSLLGESETAEFIKRNIEWVEKHKKIILALDNDDAGHKAMELCLDVLPKDRVFKANLRHEDPNEYLKSGYKNNNLLQEMDNFMQDVYWNATPVVDYGIIGSGDLYECGLEAANVEGIPLPFHMYDLKEFVPELLFDSITLIVGSTSIGKTANLDTITTSIIMNTREHVGVLSLEASRQRFAQKMASRIIGVPMNRLPREEQIRLQTEHKDKLMEFYRDEHGDHRFFFADSDFDSIQEAEECILRLIKVHGCKVIVGDPIQNIIGNKTNEEQRSFMLFLEKIKKRYGVLVLLGTHTRKASSKEKSGSDGSVQKEDAIEGSGSISKSASLIITLSRNKNADNYIDRNTTWYSVPKNRDFEMTGELVARSFYRASCSRLYPYSYAEAHNFFQDDVVGQVVHDDGIGFYMTAEEFDQLQDNSEVDMQIGLDTGEQPDF